MQTPPRQVRATARFAGSPGREKAAAEAWAFEMKYYFLRGVGEPPQVTYANGVYTCSGLIQTTHPTDRDPVDFTADAPWDLAFSAEPTRRARLRELYEAEAAGRPRFDGKDMQ